jgi:hypothetical protein
MTIIDSDAWMILAISVLAQESLQVLVGDPKDTFEPVRYQLPRVDPAADRPRRNPQRFRDVGNGEKSQMISAIAPRANGSISEVGPLRFNHFATSHVGDLLVTLDHSGHRRHPHVPRHSPRRLGPACAGAPPPAP